MTPIVYVEKTVKTILSDQTSGFLVQGPYPFTHALSPYTGCAYGQTTCGMYCYAQHLPNWQYRSDHTKGWGQMVEVKVNAAAVLDAYLASARPALRQGLRIFMATSTDPYQPPAESRWQITRQLLEVFARYDDLDLLVVQTRSRLVARDFALLKAIPYARLSISIETDDPQYTAWRGGPPPAQRLALATAAVQAGVRTQIASSPCLPYTPAFATALLNTGVQRFVVDTAIAGDGSHGQRTRRTLRKHGLDAAPWFDEEPARDLFTALAAEGMDVGWSTEGWGGIPYRNAHAERRFRSKHKPRLQQHEISFAAAQIPPDAMVLRLTAPEAHPPTLAGFPYFWIKYVSGANLVMHCAAALAGHWHRGFKPPIALPTVQVLNQYATPYVYLCGVADSQWSDNIHVPMAYAQGESIEMTTYNGIRIQITNARLLPIPCLASTVAGAVERHVRRRGIRWGPGH